MGNETFKKRQKEVSRREKRQKKAARLTERRNERAKTGSEPQEKTPSTGQSVSRSESKGNPKYFACATRFREPRRKSEITLYNDRHSGKITSTSAMSVGVVERSF